MSNNLYMHNIYIYIYNVYIYIYIYVYIYINIYLFAYVCVFVCVCVCVCVYIKMFDSKRKYLTQWENVMDKVTTEIKENNKLIKP